MADELARNGAEVVRVEAEWGRAIPTERLLDAARGPSTRCSSSTARPRRASPSRSTASARRAASTTRCFLVDCVTSLGGHPLPTRRCGVDAAFCGTQKCLNCPPGLAPFTAGERALRSSAPRRPVALVVLRPRPRARLLARRRRPRLPPHRADQHGLRAARGAARSSHEEGLEARWERHAAAHARAARRARRARLRAARARGRAAAPAARGPRARRRRRRRRPRRAAAASTASRSPAGSGRSPARCGGSA